MGAEVTRIFSNNDSKRKSGVVPDLLKVLYKCLEYLGLEKVNLKE